MWKFAVIAAVASCAKEDRWARVELQLDLFKHYFNFTEFAFTAGDASGRKVLILIFGRYANAPGVAPRAHQTESPLNLIPSASTTRALTPAACGRSIHHIWIVALISPQSFFPEFLQFTYQSGGVTLKEQLLMASASKFPAAVAIAGAVSAFLRHNGNPPHQVVDAL